MGTYRVLIVDDSTTSRMITRRCLEISGYHGIEYSEADDGLKALAYLKENDVDLVVSDLKMPKMDGTTFIRKLKTSDKTKDLPVIVVSSMGNDVTEKQLEEEGVSGVIKKPISPEKVKTAIAPLLAVDGAVDDDDDDLLGGLL